MAAQVGSAIATLSSNRTQSGSRTASGLTVRINAVSGYTRAALLFPPANPRLTNDRTTLTSGKSVSICSSAANVPPVLALSQTTMRMFRWLWSVSARTVGISHSPEFQLTTIATTDVSAVSSVGGTPVFGSMYGIRSESRRELQQSSVLPSKARWREPIASTTLRCRSASGRRFERVQRQHGHGRSNCRELDDDSLWVGSSRVRMHETGKQVGRRHFIAST